jgi:hypothetical protein
MNIINPNEIGSKISTLIAEAQQKFYVISPYIDISEWKKIIINLERAIQRGVEIKVFFREMKEKDFRVLNQLGIRLHQINGLHTKLYFNESEVIVSSMNLYEFSDLHSIDIALHFNEQKDYNKLFDYFQKYISINDSNERPPSKQSQKDLKKIHANLEQRFPDGNISDSGTYLFSNRLVPKFDLFIENFKIGFKYYKKNPEQQLVERLNEVFNKNFGDKVKYGNYNTTPTNIYHKWEIDILSNEYIDFVNVITKAQGIEFN